VLDKAKMVLGIVAASVAGCAAAPPEDLAVGRDPSARELSPNLSEEHIVLFNRAVRMTSELRYEEAAREFFRLAGLFEEAGAASKTAEATFWLGFCYEKLGYIEKAKILYEQCVRGYPTSPAARQAADRLRRLPKAPPSPPG